LPINGEGPLNEAEHGETGLTRSDLDWPIKDVRVSGMPLKDADGQSVAEQWRVEGGNHAWFGGDPRAATRRMSVSTPRRSWRDSFWRNELT